MSNNIKYVNERGLTEIINFPYVHTNTQIYIYIYIYIYMYIVIKNLQ